MNSIAITQVRTLVTSLNSYGYINDILYYSIGDKNIDPIKPFRLKNDDINSKYILYYSLRDINVTIIPSKSPIFLLTLATKELFPPEEIEEALYRLFKPRRVSFYS